MEYPVTRPGIFVWKRSFFRMVHWGLKVSMKETLYRALGKNLKIRVFLILYVCKQKGKRTAKLKNAENGETRKNVSFPKIMLDKLAI